MATPTTSVAEFLGTPLSIINHAGKRWLTAEQAGRALGYNEANARQGVNNLYNRHEDEFTEEDSTIIKLMTVDGKQREARIFSDTGCNMLGFFANTPRAKDFRAWAKKALAAQPVQNAQNAQNAPLVAQLQAQLAQQAQQLAAMQKVAAAQALANSPRLRQAMKYHAIEGLNHQEKARLMGNTRPESWRNVLKELAALGLIDYRPDPLRAAIGRAQQGNLLGCKPKKALAAPNPNPNRELDLGLDMPQNMQGGAA